MEVESNLSAESPLYCFVDYDKLFSSIKMFSSIVKINSSGRVYIVGLLSNDRYYSVKTVNIKHDTETDFPKMYRNYLHVHKLCARPHMQSDSMFLMNGCHVIIPLMRVYSPEISIVCVVFGIDMT